MKDDYRSYMDRIHTPVGLHQTLMEGEARPKRESATLRWMPAAACCVLALAGCLWGVRLASGNLGSGVEPVAGATPAQAETPAPTAQETPAPARITPDPDVVEPYVLQVEDPFEGQVHGDFNLPGVEFTQCSTGGMAVDYALGDPEGMTTTYLTKDEVVHALGGTDEVPWSLCWAGFSLGGYAHFDHQRELLSAVISGEREATDISMTTIALTMTPNQLPPEDVIYGEVEEQEYPLNGVPVKAYFIDMENGEYLYRAECMSGDTGVRLDVTASDQEEAAHLVLCFLRAAAGFESFTTEGLVLDEDSIITRVDRQLTLAEGYTDTLGSYLPRYVPEEFEYSGGGSHAIWNERGDWTDMTLTANWNWGYSYVDVIVQRSRGKRSSFVPALPEFTVDAITAEELEDIGSYVDSDRGDEPGWRYQFVMDYGWEDGQYTVAVYTIKGLTPEKAAHVVQSCAYSMCTGLPLAPTPEP